LGLGCICWWYNTKITNQVRKQRIMYLIILFLFLYTFLAYRRLDLSVMLFLFALPSYQVRFNVLGIPITLLEGMILISFAIWFLKNWKEIFENLKSKIQNQIENRKSKIENSHRYPFDTKIILLLIISFTSIAVAGFSNSAFGVFKTYFFEPILVYILIFNVFSINTNFTNEKRILRIANIVLPLAVSALCVSVYAILQRFGVLYSPENFLPRVTGTFFYPNAVGLYLGPLVPLMIGWALLKENGFKKIFFIITIITSLTAIFFAKSEGAMIGLLVAFIVMFVFWIFTKFNFNLLIPKMLVAIIFLFVIVSPFIFLKIIPEYKYFNFKSVALNYVSDKTMLKDFSGEVRKQQWRETWQMLTKSPKNFIFGAGLSGYQTSVKPYHQDGIFFNKDREVDFRNKIVWSGDEYKQKHWRPVEIYMYPHNFILNVWSELGLFGVVLVVWIIFKSIMYLVLRIKQKDNLALCILGAFIVIIVHGLVDVPYFKNDLAVMFWVLVAMVGMIDLENKKIL